MKWISSTSDKYWQEKKIETDVQSAHRAVITADQAQRIKGFGGCFNELGYHALKKAGSSDREKVFDQLFGQNNCRFSFCRVPIGASDYALSWYSHSEVAEDYKLKNFNIDRDRQNLLPYIKEAQKVNPEIDFFASPWSPPVWMKTMQTFNYGNLRWEEPVLKTYALYFKKFVEAFAAEGIKISQVHVQNEPRSNQKFPSCVWTGSKMRDFIKDYLGPLFKKENIPCEIWAGTIEKGIEHGYHCDKVGKEDFSSWAHTILSDPDCRKYVSGVGYQWDGKGALQRTRHAFPEVPIIQTENECGDGQNSWAYALYVFNLMWDYFTNGAAAYVYWNMVLPQGGESTWGWHQNAMINIADEGQVIY
ncbi:MAG TPA: glycosyl hydrolase, partial [Spirochaetota bacterium]|nr:glycosyl hydrolase [Spirochaetota bacterium]